ncbi:synaptic vesicle glycoprotein 2a [Lasius niger]|uniref:Synaptic vesicle glycoprotein 2a n=1 Tax=Lasius niger TaxID=67767 RepID=A0A0J7P1X8_LASNI|nr:synaptic vesicle glycoprotein 2a [Lasius niger]
MERDHVVSGNDTCNVHVQNLASGFLRSCDEVNEARFGLLLLVSLGYVLGEMLLIIGINAVGRKLYLTVTFRVISRSRIPSHPEYPMAEDNARPAEESGAFEVERKLDRPSRPRDQRGAAKVKDKPEDTRLPTPPPDPQCLKVARDRTGVTSRGPEEEEEDLATYLSELGASPFEGHSFDYDTTPNSATSAMGGDAVPFTEEVFEHLDRLYALTEQILELRSRSSKFFRRVRGLERAKVQRNADRRLEVALANDEEELLRDFTDEDTGFAESLLDAMLSNCRDAASTPRRGERLSVRSPSSSRQRSRSLAPAEQNLASSNLVERAAEAPDKRGTFARNASRNGGPKVSKWTRVKAAFKWERACTNDLADIAESSMLATASSTPTTKYLRIPDAITAGSWSAGPALSPCTSEISSPSTPIGRVSPASSSNEEVFDDQNFKKLITQLFITENLGYFKLNSGIVN